MGLKEKQQQEYHSSTVPLLLSSSFLLFSTYLSYENLIGTIASS